MATARAQQPITAERIEQALDRLAMEIKAFGHRGRVLLPMYAFLEEELAKIRRDEETMDAVLARLKRVEGRTEARSPAARRA